MTITDGKKLVNIRIQRWNGTGYDPDWSEDYFDAGSLPCDEDSGIYIVDDVDYCVDIALSTDAEGACSKLDPETGEAVEDEDMHVFVEDAGEFFTPEETALLLRINDEWVPELCDRLVHLADLKQPGIEAEYQSAECGASILYRAAKILGVDIV